MSAPLVPSPLDYVGRRPFALYPAVRHTGANEWRITGSTWSGIHVSNIHSNEQFWIPRHYVRGVSDAAGLPLVVELTTEMAIEGETVAPVSHPVIEMPIAPKARRSRRRGRATVVDIRMEHTASPSRGLAKFGLALVALCLVSALLLEISRW